MTTELIQWEYKCEIKPRPLSFNEEIDYLNEMGKSGWNNYFMSKNIYYFKRPIIQSPTEKQP